MVKSALARLPAGIWTLGVVSMLMDVSSELIHSLLPLFLVTTLGASALTVGVIEGSARERSARPLAGLWLQRESWSVHATARV